MPTKSADHANGVVPRRWATINEAVAYLSVHPRTIRQLVYHGQIPQYSLGPRLKRLDLNELDAILTRQGATTGGGGGA